MGLMSIIIDFAELLKTTSYTILELPEELYDLSSSKTRWELSIELCNKNVYPSKDFAYTESITKCIDSIKDSKSTGDTVYYTLNFIALHETFMQKDLRKFILEGSGS